MNEYIIMPSTDYQSICDSLRAASEKTALIKSGELSSEIDKLASKIGKVFFKSIPLISSQKWRSIAYGNGKFVALNSEGTIATYSEDGINWTEVKLPLNEKCTFIEFCGDRFITASNGSVVSSSAAFSTDGIKWTTFTLPADEYWTSAAYGNGIFVIGCSSSSSAYSGIVYSNDFINWNWKSLPRKDMDFQSVTYGDGKFVAVTRTYAAYSTDGINWTKTSLPASDQWISVTYGDGKFVAVNAVGSNIAACSTDGINWTKVELPYSRYYRKVIYGNGKFITTAETSSDAAYSTDGINWSTYTLPSYGSWYGIAYGDNKFVAVAYNSSDAALCDLNSVGIA